MSADTIADPELRGHADDYQEHVRTYKGFVRAVMFGIAAAVATLVLMALFLV